MLPHVDQKLVHWFVLGACVEYNEHTKLDKKDFEEYVRYCMNVVWKYLHGTQTLDGSCTDALCDLAHQALYVFRPATTETDVKRAARGELELKTVWQLKKLAESANEEPLISNADCQRLSQYFELGPEELLFDALTAKLEQTKTMRWHLIVFAHEMDAGNVSGFGIDSQLYKTTCAVLGRTPKVRVQPLTEPELQEAMKEYNATSTLMLEDELHGVMRMLRLRIEGLEANASTKTSEYTTYAKQGLEDWLKEVTALQARVHLNLRS
jgi:hypothetical protein